MEDTAKKDPIKYPWRIPEWFPTLVPDVQAKLKLYSEELLRFNKGVSLVSSGTIDKIDLAHFSDSILGWQVMKPKVEGSLLWDIGSGNGFPGLVIAILEPKLNLVLLDSDTRKAEFLKHVIHICDLKNVRVMARRLEEVDPAAISVAVVRGFANLSKCLLSMRKYMAPKGMIFHFKGPEWISEATNMPQQLCSTWNTAHVGDYVLPDGKSHHSIVKSDLV